MIPSTKVNSLSPALTAVTAVASFASFARCYKLLAAKPQFHFNVNIAHWFDFISKGQFIKSSTSSSVSQSVTYMGRIWSDPGPIKIAAVFHLYRLHRVKSFDCQIVEAAWLLTKTEIGLLSMGCIGWYHESHTSILILNCQKLFFFHFTPRLNYLA